MNSTFKKIVSKAQQVKTLISAVDPSAVIFLYHTIEREQEGMVPPSPWVNGHRYITPLNSFIKQIEFIQKHFTVVV